MANRLSLLIGTTTLAALLAAPSLTEGNGGVPRFYRPGYSGHGATYQGGMPRSGGCGYVPGPGPGVVQPLIPPYPGAYSHYGQFSGARHDEATLLHLGGEGPYTGVPDIITLIEGSRSGGGAVPGLGAHGR